MLSTVLTSRFATHLPAVLRDAEAAETTAQLAGRVGRLRDALETFGRG